MRCETTPSVKECALRARSTHGVHHAIVEVNIVIGVVLGEVACCACCSTCCWCCNWSRTLSHGSCCCCRFCEGGVDVVGVVTPLVRGGAQVLHGDQVVELSVLLVVHEKEEKGEDGDGQIEAESERGELKERRTCTWMTWRDSELEPDGACDPTSRVWKGARLRSWSGVVHLARVHVQCHCTCWCGLSHACPQCSCRSSCCMYTVSVASFL